MSALDAAKEVVRMASTAGLAKEVVGLMEKKLALLTDEVAMLTTKVSKLEIENRQLRSQLKNPQPIPKLDSQASKALKHFYDRAVDVQVDEIAKLLGCSTSLAQFQCDTLLERGFIFDSTIPMNDPRFDGFGDVSAYIITSEGRQFVVNNAV